MFLFSVDTSNLLLASFECPLYQEHDKAKRLSNIGRKSLGVSLGFLEDKTDLISYKTRNSSSSSENDEYQTLDRMPLEWLNKVQAEKKGYLLTPLDKTNIIKMRKSRPFSELIASSAKGPQ